MSAIGNKSGPHTPMLNTPNSSADAAWKFYNGLTFKNKSSLYLMNLNSKWILAQNKNALHCLNNVIVVIINKYCYYCVTVLLHCYIVTYTPHVSNPGSFGELEVWEKQNKYEKYWVQR